jgi:hypothetical protein
MPPAVHTPTTAGRRLRRVRSSRVEFLGPLRSGIWLVLRAAELLSDYPFVRLGWLVDSMTDSRARATALVGWQSARGALARCI